jgi:CRISPR/Cas system-associated protein endoribonuclease Cas2
MLVDASMTQAIVDGSMALPIFGAEKKGRGQMRVLDEDGLRNGSCECLEIIEKQFERVFETAPRAT